MGQTQKCLVFNQMLFLVLLFLLISGLIFWQGLILLAEAKNSFVFFVGNLSESYPITGFLGN